MKFGISVICLFFGLVCIAQQPGTLDKSFNPGDPGYGRGDANGYVTLIWKNNTLLTTWSEYNPHSPNEFAIINSTDGLLVDYLRLENDSFVSFSPVHLFPDGRFLALAQTSHFYPSKYYLRRFFKDGSADRSFSDTSIIDPGYYGYLFELKIQPDGKILIGGKDISVNNQKRGIIARLKSDGTTDSEFHIGSLEEPLRFNSVDQIEIQKDNKIWISGTIFNYDNSGRQHLLRLNPDGTVDSSCAMTNITSLSQIELQKDGKLVGVGSYSMNTLNSEKLKYNGLIRFNIDGTRDSSFPNESIHSAIYNYTSIKDMQILDDGRILFCGEFRLSSGDLSPMETFANLLCYTTDGEIDKTFRQCSGTTGYIAAIRQLDDGNIILVGEFNFYHRVGRNNVVKINLNGEVDSHFYSGYGLNSIDNFCEVDQITPALNNTFYVGGYFSRYNGISANSFIKIREDGSVDETFDVGTGYNNWVKDIIVQKDQKIVVLGDLGYYKNTAVPAVFRLETNGDLDTTFNAPIELRPSIIRLGNNNVIWVVAYNDTLSKHCIYQLSADGTRNHSKEICLGTGNMLRSIEVQPDGKLIIVGIISEVNGQRTFNIARLNEDGSLDPTFDSGAGFDNGPTRILIQKDGKIMLTGLMKYYDGKPVHKMLRLHPTGELDTQFNFDSRINNSNSRIYWYQELLQLSDGSYLLSGEFWHLNDGTLRKLIKINSNGALNNDFIPPSTIGNNYITALAEQSDGKILIAGVFYEINGIGVNRIGRLHNTLATSVNETEASENIVIYPNPSNGKFILQLEKINAKYFSINELTGKELIRHSVIAGLNEIDLESLSEGMYFLNIYTTDGIISQKILKGN